MKVTLARDVLSMLGLIGGRPCYVVVLRSPL